MKLLITDFNILPRWKTENLSPKIEIDLFDDFMEIGTYI